MTVRMTRRVRRIIDAIHTLDQPWGLTICQTTGYGPGTVYPILDRLEASGWIGSRREEKPPPGRPARTFYHLTLHGQHAAGLQPVGHDAGPSVREAAADDRVWDLEKAGE